MWQRTPLASQHSITIPIASVSIDDGRDARNVPYREGSGAVEVLRIRQVI